MKQEIIAARDALDIITHRGEQDAIVYLRGRVDIDSSPLFRDRLLGMLRGEPREVVIVDLTEVSYMEGSGIATLIEGLKIAQKQQKTLCLRGLQGALFHLFQVTGISTLFQNGCGSAPPAEKVS